MSAPEIGDAVPQVHESRFAVVGAGGLGGPVLLALAAARPRELLFFDDDEVELSNLQRQIQFTTADIGRLKVDAMADELVRRGTSRGQLRPIAQRFAPPCANPDTQSAGRAHPASADLFPGAPPDVIIDGSDNLATKFAVNDFAVRHGIPCVIAGVLRYSGQVLPVLPGRAGCYRCLFEEPPPEEDVADCGGAGVLGAAVAVVAGHAARAALALARGESHHAGSLLVFDDLSVSSRFRSVRFRSRADCPSCTGFRIRSGRGSGRGSGVSAGFAKEAL